ncbi:unnamed protein product [Darwinula stevensoni]|uniref:Uncharacterized protein n=1 Tax=Darwinula stevensoni TaxID=69355 RepID=A0A7R9A8B0_9CRUS|nr:unnamed protein product [Darwinula stevensoni]CAG0896216.1 unnamed protein product [Darwinula stevensoni]
MKIPEQHPWKRQRLHILTNINVHCINTLREFFKEEEKSIKDGLDGWLSKSWLCSQVKSLLKSCGVVKKQGESLIQLGSPHVLCRDLETELEKLETLTSKLLLQSERRGMALEESLELHSHLDKANAWCAEGVSLLGSLKPERLWTPEYAENLLASITQFLQSRESTFPDAQHIPLSSLALVSQVESRMEDIMRMCEKRAEALERAKLVHASRPVQAVSPVPLSLLRSISAPSQPLSSSPLPSNDVVGVQLLGGVGLGLHRRSAQSSSTKRRHAFRELMDSERVYVAELQSVILGYRDEMENPELSHLLSPEIKHKSSILFGNLDHIHRFHQDVFLPCLEEAGGSLHDVGCCFFDKKETFLTLYVRYCQNKPLSEELWGKVGGVGAGANPFFSHCQKQLGHKLPLGAYLLKPVQRITKYQLLLKDLIQYSDEGDDGVASLQDALETMLTILKSVNDAMHQVAISGFPGSLADQGRLLMQGPFLVWLETEGKSYKRKERLKELQRLQKPKPRHVFLFKRAVVLCKSSISKDSDHSALPAYDFKTYLNMSEVGLTETVKGKGEGESRKFELWLSGRQEVYVLQASSTEAKQEWIGAIKSVLMSQLESLREQKLRKGHSITVPLPIHNHAPFLNHFVVHKYGGLKIGSLTLTLKGITYSRSLKATSSLEGLHTSSTSSESSPVQLRGKKSSQSIHKRVSGSDLDALKKRSSLLEEDSSSLSRDDAWSLGSSDNDNDTSSSDPSVKRRSFVCLGDYVGSDGSELSLREGEEVEVVRHGPGSFWLVRNPDIRCQNEESTEETAKPPMRNTHPMHARHHWLEVPMDEGQSPVGVRTPNLNDMSKEDLIKRYKNVLVIAQKAKKSKDEIASRVEPLEQKISFLEQELVDKKNLEEELENMKQILNQERGSFVEAREAYQKQLEDMKADKGQMESVIQQALSDKEELHLQLQKLSVQRQEMEEQLNAQIQASTEKLDSLAQEKTELLQQWQSLTSQNADKPSLQSQLEEYQGKLKESELKNSELLAQLKDLQDQISKSGGELLLAKTVAEEKESEVGSLQSALADAGTKLHEKNEEVTTLKSSLLEVKMNLEKKEVELQSATEDAKQLLEERDKELENLKSNLANLQDQALQKSSAWALLEQELKSKADENDSLREKLEAAAQKKTQLSQMLDKVDQEKKKLAKELQETLPNMASLEEERQMVEKLKCQHEEERAEWAKEQSQLEGNLMRLSGEVDQQQQDLMERERRQVSEWQKEKDTLCEKLQCLEDENEVLRKTCVERNSLSEGLEQNLQGLEKALMEERLKCKQLEEIKVSLEDQLAELEQSLSSQVETRQKQEAEFLTEKEVLSSKICILEAAQSEQDALRAELKELEIKVGEQTKIISDLESANNALKSNLKEHESANEELCSIEQENIGLKSKLAGGLNELTALKLKVSELEQVVLSLESQKNTLESHLEELESANEDVSILKQEQLELEQKLQLSVESIKVLNEQASLLKSNVTELEEERVQLTSKLEVAEKLKSEVETTTSKLNQREAEIVELQSRLVEEQNSTELLRKQSAEHLDEMKGMNEIIKQRGEKLAKLEADLANLHAENATLKLQEGVEKDHADLAKLKAENEELRMKIHDLMLASSRTFVHSFVKYSHNQYVENIDSANVNDSREEGDGKETETSEFASTSTFSRTEESQRMRDVDGSLEEYNQKLKVIAIKQKKKIADLTSQLNAFLEEKRRLNMEPSVPSQGFQSEMDALRAQLERSQVANAVLKKDMDAAIESHTTAKQDHSQCIEERDAALLEVKTLTEKLKDKTKDAETRLIHNQEEAGRTSKREAELREELERTKEKLRAAERNEAREQQKCKEALEKLDRAQQEAKKHSVLNLEIADYERTIADLSARLKDKDRVVGELKEEISSTSELVTGLKEQLRMAADQEAQERQRAEHLKSQLGAVREQLATSRKKEAENMAIKSQLESQVELLTQQVEAGKLEMSEVLATKERLLESTTIGQESLKKQVSVLESQLSTANQECLEMKSELLKVQTEFESYKVRAQSVFKQQKSRSSVREEMQAEREQLQAQFNKQIQALRTRNQELEEKMKTLMVEKKTQEEANALLEQTKLELEETLHTREGETQCEMQDLRTQLQGLRDSLTEARTQNSILTTSYQDELEKQRQVRDSMEKTLRHQIAELEQETVRLRGERDAAQQEAAREQAKLQEELRIDISNTPREEGEGSPQNGAACWANPLSPLLDPAPSFIEVHPYLQESHQANIAVAFNVLKALNANMAIGGGGRHPPRTLDPPLAGHGSESVDLVSPSTGTYTYNRDMIPLEQLLSNGEDPSSPSPRMQSPTAQDLEGLRTQLSNEARRARHLALLLNESEANNAKLSQLSDALKEEIRRRERNEERKEHLEHLEYLKNIILKFLLLSSGDERMRLVPVLTTMLRLSPAETSQLNTVAQGGDQEQSPRAGWGQYLGLWSGGE